MDKNSVEKGGQRANRWRANGLSRFSLEKKSILRGTTVLLSITFLFILLSPSIFNLEWANALTNETKQSILDWNKKGLDLLREGSYYNQANSYFDKALTIDPNFSTTLNNKGFTLFSLGNYSDALAYYDRAIAANTSNDNAYNNKGYSLLSVGNNTDAIPYLDKAIELNPITKMP